MINQLALFFSEKNFHKQFISLKEKGETITNNNKNSPFVYNSFNNYLFSSWSPFVLQNANFTPVFKKKYNQSVVDYQLVSIFSQYFKNLRK